MQICLHQWIKPRGPYVEAEGVGKCEDCTPHEDNKHCLRYYAIAKPITFEVKEKEDAVH